MSAGPVSTVSPEEQNRDPALPSSPLAKSPFLLLVLANARWLWPLLVVSVVVAAAWSDVRTIDYHQVRRALRDQGLWWLILAALVTVANLAIMGLYDVICLRGTRIRARDRWWTGTLAFAWSNFLTLGPLAGPAIRFWLYR